ncbi:PREDICTED: uncharacterized protein LOC105457936 [Wasmannia auropunctata]|uniref:uncharacterized protein LOC105457936 n=1 Tax=Wasmannia auropunctata TaxID=64793 RepID=UPI0005F0B8AB|nr:PREDICTED: uncharacterized protein LOC105457936 [Wasmannia auropunctata]
MKNGRHFVLPSHEEGNTRQQPSPVKFWQMEEVESNYHLSPEEIKCEEHYRSTISRADDDRFVVQLPLKMDPPTLGESYDTARKRFQAIERKLNRDHQLKKKYHEFMEEYLQLGHMSEVEAESPAKQAYYLPHHAVIKDDSTTTKVRVVFDASCRTTSGRFLNDIMMVGPTIQDELFCIIIYMEIVPTNSNNDDALGESLEGESVDDAYKVTVR